ncbi:hypothetical protein LX36DRAFT_682916 [Colletotrichum falcatum]|nr:hypothetical protein LX36DRAFT_682916 [Colletotrichum falcatum]
MARPRSQSVGRVNRPMRARQLRRFHNHLVQTNARQDLLSRFTEEALSNIDFLIDGGDWQEVPEGSDETEFDDNWKSLPSLTTQLSYMKRWKDEKSAVDEEEAAVAGEGGGGGEEEEEGGGEPEQAQNGSPAVSVAGTGEAAESGTSPASHSESRRSSLHMQQFTRPAATMTLGNHRNSLKSPPPPLPRKSRTSGKYSTDTRQGDDAKLKDRLRDEYEEYRVRYNNIPDLYKNWLFASRNASLKHRETKKTLQRVRDAEAVAAAARLACLNVDRAEGDKAYRDWASAMIIHRAEYDAWERAEK